MTRQTFVTGFGPFAKAHENPSAVLAAACDRPHQVLEVSWAAVDEWLRSEEAEPYTYLLHLGFADRDHLTPELFARNVIGPAPDVRGEVREGEMEPNGPLLLESTLCSAELVAGLLSDDRIRVSEDAGTYLCNYIAYRSQLRFPDKRVGFLHVPSFEKISEKEQVEVVRSVITAIESAD